MQLQSSRLLREEHRAEAVHRWDCEWLLLTGRPGVVPWHGECSTQPWQVLCWHCLIIVK